MEGVEPESSKSQSLQEDSQITPGNSEWLAEHVKGFKKCVDETLKLIGQDGNLSEMTVEIHDQRKLELTIQVTELSRIYGELADQHQHLIGELSKTCPSPMEKQHLHSSDPTSPQVTPMSTPDQTQKFSTPIGFDAVLSPGGGFYLSERETSALASASASSGADDDALKVKESKHHEDLLQKIANLEVELATLNSELQSLGDENTKLMEKIKENESAAELAEDLAGELEYSRNSVVILNNILEAKKSKEEELENRVSDLLLVVSHSQGKMDGMGEELEATKKKLSAAEENISKLKRKKSGKHSEETSTKVWEDQLGSTNQLIEILKKQLESQSKSIAGLQEILSSKTDALKFRDDQILELETKLKQSLSEIERLTTELNQKRQLVDDLNKEMEGLKQKHEEVMSSRNSLLEKLDTRLKSLRVEYERVVSSFKSVQKVRNELQLEVGRQRELLLDRAEEKREVIRQLTITLEHYMSRYKELCQAFKGHRRNAPSTS